MSQQAKAKINGAEIAIVIDNRALIDYKREKGRQGCNDLDDLMYMTWLGIRSGARRAQVKFEMTYEAFIDYTSDHDNCLPTDYFEAKQDDSESAGEKKI